VPGAKPLLIYDGRCSFCKIWIDYFRLRTGDRVAFAPSQDVGDQYPQIPPKAFAESVQLVRPDGTVARGARAVFEALGMERTYESSRGFAILTEWAYRIIARHRGFFYHVTRLTFGTHIEPARFASTQWLFLRLLAIVYAIAFASLGVQVDGLIGSRGILPAGDFLNAVAQSLSGPTRYMAMPTVFWMNASDGMFRGVSIAGVALAVLLFLGFVERLALVLLFVLYLSLSNVGQDFLSFQWDALLLEAGFLGIFLGRSQVVVWLYRWLVFRLLFLSGCVKLLSNDPSWRNLSALGFHYYTQPLPTVFAWYMEQLPQWFHRASTLVVLVTEIGVPFLIFMPRRIRMFGAACLLALQLLILITGNYTFFNILTMALCLFLFDDRALAWLAVKVRWGRAMSPQRPARGERAVAGAVAALVLTLGITRMSQSLSGDAPEPLRSLARIASPFQIVNSYGLFAVMTTSRPEIIVEGSNDDETWLAYEFRYKPGDLYVAPRWVAPHQPRLDWQMWFAALSNYRANLWFVAFAARLLEGSPPVLGLLEKNPFPDRPPRYVRAVVFEYKFTDWPERRKTGAWWKREPKGTYLPPMGLRALSRAKTR